MCNRHATKAASGPEPRFCRHRQLPFLECRIVTQGHKVCYARHSHKEWSLGLIVQGESLYRVQNLSGPGEQETRVSAGDLVCINPEQVHACCALEGKPWSYIMFYLDTGWLAQLACELGLQAVPVWQDLPVNLLRDARLFAELERLAQALQQPSSEPLQRQAKAVMGRVLQRLSLCAPHTVAADNAESLQARQLRAAVAAIAGQLDQYPEQPLPLARMSTESGISASRLIRAFSRYYGLTPHAYQINRRIQLGQQILKQGAPIADAALAAGFADQPHFQRVFKKLVQATPKQYRSG